MVLQQRQALKADMDAAVTQESSRAAAARSIARDLELQLVRHQLPILRSKAPTRYARHLC